MNLVATHYISCTALQLHITYGLHLPSCTALTHSHPPLHQSHSCHQSLLTLIVSPHLHLILTHTFKQHISFQHCEVLFLLWLTFLSVYHPLWLLSLCLTPDCLTLELWTCDLDPCLVLFTSLLCLWYSCYCPLTIACLILPLSSKYYCTWIHTPLTSLYRRLKSFKVSTFSVFFVSAKKEDQMKACQTLVLFVERDEFGHLVSLWRRPKSKISNALHFNSNIVQTGQQAHTALIQQSICYHWIPSNPHPLHCVSSLCIICCTFCILCVHNLECVHRVYNVYWLL